MTSQTPSGTLATLVHADGADRAIVIGAGIAGLLAARALADHVAEVIVLDRDDLPAAPAHRRNTPQSQHVHGLLARGTAIIELQFPGIGAELVAAGALPARSRSDLTWHQGGGYLARTRRDIGVLVQSRPLLEHHLRRRVVALPNVTILAGCQVTGLLATRDRRAVTGVRVVTDADPTEHELFAALTIDASGRGSRLPGWLEALGLAVPPRVTAGVEACYATRRFRRVPGQETARAVTVIVASAETRRGGVMLAQEGGEWLVTLSSRDGTQPPTELSGFIDWARGLDAPDIYDVVRHAIPLDDGVIYRFPQSSRRHWERMAGFPAGLLPIGDTICAFNPVYAQGMTIAAIEAEALGRCLARGTAGLASRYFGAIAPSVEAAWAMAAMGDLRYAGDPASLPRPVRLAGAYMARLLVAARRDPVVAEAFHRVTNLIDPPQALRRPAIAVRVAYAGRRPASPAPTRIETPRAPARAA